MIRIVETTLREGEQTPGVYFSRHTKLAIAELLDEIGVDVIEAGHPLVSADVKAAVTTLSASSLRASIGAHARSLKGDVDAALDCGVNFLGVFYCVSDHRLEGVHRQTLADAVTQVQTVIADARGRNPALTIRYTPEDAVRSNFENVVTAAAGAVEAGADIISVADTTGVMVPGSQLSLGRYVARLREALAQRGLSPSLAVHCHNDRGLALANALDGIAGGADTVDASVLGLGERAGIVDLATLLALLQERGEGHYRLECLPELYALVARETGIPVPVNHPIVGANAFTHCAGVHTQAALKDPRHYQSLDPALFGRTSEICLDHMAGLAAVRHSLALIGAPSDMALAQAVLEDVKRAGERGRRVALNELPYMVACHAEGVS